ncbi:hypothetical protein CH302_08910, partial [Rhodococcus sp. 15-2388-1-1a]
RYAPGGNALSVAAFGVDPAQTAGTNTPLFQAAITAAQEQGKDLYIPWMPGSSLVLLNESMNILDTVGPGVRIYGQGARSRLRNTARKPVFFVRAEDTTIEGVTFYGDGLDMTGMASLLAYQNYVGVRIHPLAHGAQVRNIRARDLYVAVRPGGDHRGDPLMPAPATSPNLERFVADGVSVKGVWSAVFGGSLQDSQISNIRGTFKKAFGSNIDTGQPPHLVYIYSPGLNDAAGTGDVGVRSKNLVFDNIQGWDSGADPGAVFAPKWVDGMVATNIAGRNCQGVLDFIGITDAQVSNVMSFEDKYPNTGEASSRASVAVKQSERVQIDNASISFSAGDHGKAVFVEADAYDCHLSNFQLVSNHTVSDTVSSRSTARLAGVRNTFENFTLINRGLTVGVGILVVGTGKYGSVINPKVPTPKYRYPVRIEANHPAPYLDYDPAQLKFDTSIGSALPVSFVNAGTTVRDRSLTNVVLPQAPGFTASFFGENGDPVTVTDGGKAITTNNTNSGSWTHVNSGRAKLTSVSGTSYLVVDGLSALGTMTVVVPVMGDNTGGIIVAYQDTTNQVLLQFRTGAGDNRPRLVKRVAGAVTVPQSAPSGTVSAAGDTYLVTRAADGAINVKLNGVDIINVTVADFATSTKWGVYGSTNSGPEIDSMVMVPAA